MVKKSSFLENVMLFFLIVAIVTTIWQFLELVIYGKIESRDVDTIIALILSLSIFTNIKFVQSAIAKATKNTNISEKAQEEIK